MARPRGWRAIWLKVTLCRHRSELGALDLARKCGPLAIFPICATVCFWWLAIGLPASVPGMIGLALREPDEPSWCLVAGSLYMLSSLSV